MRSDRDLRLETIDDIPEKFRAHMLRWRPIEVRPVNPRSWIDPAPQEPHYANWFRLCAPIGDDPAMHRAILAYASDMALLGTALLPHGKNWITPGLQTASLDHSLWFHGNLVADDWLLYALDSPWAGNARGFARGSVYNRAGQLVASSAQEGLIRHRQDWS